MHLRVLSLFVALLATVFLDACGTGSTDATSQDDARYAFANGCYALRSSANSQFVRRGGTAYEATAATISDAEPFYMKPTALGKYLLYTHDGNFLAADAAASTQSVSAAAQASGDSNWTVDADGAAAFKLTLANAGKSLAIANGSGGLILADASAGGDASSFSFTPTTGCAVFPEAELDSSGEPFKGHGVDQPVLGFADSHLHITATDFLGHGHAGRPFHPYGITQALGSCEDRHGKDGAKDVIGNVMTFGNPFAHHDTQGWPTFKDWPGRDSLMHEQTYYKWLERAWRGGERLLVNFLVENETLCKIEAPLIQGLPDQDCNEMDSARLQVRQIHDLQDYIDAQEGGPGRGWFRIVTSPADARRVINDGKLAVILGIETSHLFDCAEKNGMAQCDEATIDRELDEFYSLGVRTVFPIHEFDNAYGGNGIFMSLIDIGNKIDTGHFWSTYDCPDVPYLYTAGTPLSLLAPAAPGDAAVPPDWYRLAVEMPPQLGASSKGNQCNARWITDLGQYLIRRLMAKKMMIEIDHLELQMKSQMLDMAESQTPPYPVMSGHGGHGGISIEQAKRIYGVGGLIFPLKGNGHDYVDVLTKVLPLKSDKYYFGMGYGADNNGLANEAPPRQGATPVTYPFTLFQGPDWGDAFVGIAPVNFDRQRTGVRTFDTDVDGFAHYGMIPDFVEEVRIEGGAPALDALYHSAEAYLQMWERVVNR